MDWREYEIYITKHFQNLFPGTSIQHDVKREGYISKTQRQIDILIEGSIAGFELRIIVDCKYFNKKVDVKDVESFISFLLDLKASKGVLITNNGYSEAAYNRATYDTQDIELRIISFDDLDDFQGFMAIPYSLSECALVTAPDGWVVDASGRGPSPAVFYPAGLSQQEAFEREGFISLSFSHKNKEWPDLATLLDKQKLAAEQHYQQLKMEYIDTIKREDCTVVMRVIEAPLMGNSIDYTIFLDFKESVIFMTLITYKDKEDRYVKKLEWIAQKLIKGKVLFDRNENPININL
ncbi:restriction endonuclease [Saccharospirillum mangrovi]|uniref:restriction endonuclease n=1 Tax=Saccharospirillum mangrovi TaxID=2161747 RepID=UPI000D3C1000|nr:restriction endonuclease [Saccharospirillum mangrovi]